MGIKKRIKDLKIFQNVKSTTLDKINQLGHISEFSRGTVLMRTREPVDFIYIQLSGKSIEYKLTYNGKRKVLFVFKEGALLNGRVFNNVTSSIFCETIEKSELLVISVSDFSMLMEEDFNLTKNIMMFQEKKIWKLGRQLKNTASTIPMEKRLLAKLWKLSKDFGVWNEEGLEIDMNLSITSLADMLGAPRETTSRLCSELVEAGLIKINKKKIVILNSEEIARYYKIEKIITGSKK